MDSGFAAIGEPRMRQAASAVRRPGMTAQFHSITSCRPNDITPVMTVWDV
jgi:hypothetical protein